MSINGINGSGILQANSTNTIKNEVNALNNNSIANTEEVLANGNTVIRIEGTNARIITTPNGDKFIQLGQVSPRVDVKVESDKRVSGLDGRMLSLAFNSGKVSSDEYRAKLTEIADDYMSSDMSTEEKTKVLYTISSWAKGNNGDALSSLHANEAFSHGVHGRAYYNSDYYYKYEDDKTLVNDWAKEYAAQQGVQLDSSFYDRDTSFTQRWLAGGTAGGGVSEYITFNDINKVPPRNMVIILRGGENKKLEITDGTQNATLEFKFQYPNYKKNAGTILQQSQKDLGDDFKFFLDNITFVDRVIGLSVSDYKANEGKIHPQILEKLMARYDENKEERDRDLQLLLKFYGNKI